MNKLGVLDLFSGSGGFSLGLERAGMETVAFCEIAEFPKKVLRKHWPKVPIYDDVADITASRLAADGIAADIVCGGFPCVDVSNAGGRLGLDGERSGLYSHGIRIADEIRPDYLLLENVAALLGRGLARILGDLAKIGYDAEWHCIPASYVGGIHIRDRIWIIAYPCGTRGEGLVKSEDFSEARSRRMRCQADLQSIIDAPFERGNSWPQPLLRRMDDGLPGKMDRLKAIGNAVFPDIPEIIGRAIIASMEPRT